MSSKMKKKRKKGRGRVRAVDNWKNKQWYEVYAPKAFKEQFIGEIPTSDESSLIGRTMEILLYDLTKNFQHTTTKLRFKIVEVRGNKCYTMFWGHELTRDFIRSLIHRGSSRIDGIFNFTSADGVVYRVSTFVVTLRRVKQTQMKTVRRIIRDVMQQFADNLSHEKLIQGIIFEKFSENIKKIAKTIYPLRECKIRKVKVVKVPEGLTDSLEVSSDEDFDEIEVQLGEHGKTVKAMKKKKKRKDETEEGEASEVSETELTEETESEE
jgi:small subunit ribosomal protein S3Ae